MHAHTHTHTRPKSMHFQNQTEGRKKNGNLCGYAIWKTGNGLELHHMKALGTVFWKA